MARFLELFRQMSWSEYPKLPIFNIYLDHLKLIFDRYEILFCRPDRINAKKSFMYPVSQGYPEANKPLYALSENGHHAETLLTSVFVMEKTILSTLRFCLLNIGFSSTQSDKILNNKGFKDVETLRPVFKKIIDHYLNLLETMLGNMFQTSQNAE